MMPNKSTRNDWRGLASFAPQTVAKQPQYAGTAFGLDVYVDATIPRNVVEVRTKFGETVARLTIRPTA